MNALLLGRCHFAEKAALLTLPHAHEPRNFVTQLWRVRPSLLTAQFRHVHVT